MTTSLRSELPSDVPRGIRELPVDERGYPVPWFVQWVDEDNRATEPGHGTPEFRVMDSRKLERAIAEGLCWVCGRHLGRLGSFVLGPMCAVNRNSAEPPSHIDCALWSVRACPFLTRPGMRRREGGLPEGHREPDGVMLRRNPGVMLVWVSDTWYPHTFRNPLNNQIERLIDIGEPVKTLWYREGRRAIREEILESIEGGIPTLMELAERQGVVAELEEKVKTAIALLPA